MEITGSSSGYRGFKGMRKTQGKKANGSEGIQRCKWPDSWGLRVYLLVVSRQ